MSNKYKLEDPEQSGAPLCEVCGLSGHRLLGQFIKRNGRRLFQVSDEYDLLLSIESDPATEEEADNAEFLQRVLDSPDVTMKQKQAFETTMQSIEEIEIGNSVSRSPMQLAAEKLQINHKSLRERLIRGLARLNGISYIEVGRLAE